MPNFITDLYHSVFPNKKDYLIYRIGRSNIILSAPHSGNIKPTNIPNRTYGNRSRDTYTLELIKKVVKLLPNKPYYIYSNVHRSKLDLNRDIDEACQGNPEMERLWGTWNSVLNGYLSEVRYVYKRGLYIDIHSYSGGNEFQIGYGLPTKDYLILMKDEKITTKKSTMHSLKEFLPYQYKSEHSVLFGEFSFPYSLRKYGYNIMTPKNDKYYLNGGRDIREFSGDGIGALQIECPISVLKKDLNGVAIALVKSIDIFSKQIFTNN